MAETFKRLFLVFLTESCYDEFFLRYNFLHVECLKQAISKALGIGIILGATLVKVPQIVKILKQKSAVGINFYGVLLELLAITSSAAYCYANSFPFSAWGEGLFLFIETAIIGYLVLLFNNLLLTAHAFIAIYSAVLYVLFSGITPNTFLWKMQAFNVPVVIAGKMVQAAQNYKNGNTGQLSAATVFLLFIGSCARIFTSIQETGDDLVVFTYVVATLANFIIAAQMIYYWESTNRALANNKSYKKD